MKITDRPKVGFSASIGVNGYVGPFSSDTKMIYENVLSNIGNQYDSATGNLENYFAFL